VSFCGGWAEAPAAATGSPRWRHRFLTMTIPAWSQPAGIRSGAIASSAQRTPPPVRAPWSTLQRGWRSGSSFRWSSSSQSRAPQLLGGGPPTGRPGGESHVTRRRQKLGHVAAALAQDGRFSALELAELRTEVGDPAERLAAAADELGAELLVVGAGGRTWWPTKPLGSVSSALAARAPCPVVVVPRGTRALILAPRDRSVVCGLDLDCAPAAVAEVALGLAERLGLRLVLAHVESTGAEPPRATPVEQPALRDRGQPAHSRLVRVADGLAPARPEVRLERGEAAGALERVAAQESASLLVIGAGGGGGFRPPLLGAVPQRLAPMASRPVVLVPPAIVEGVESLLNAIS
jgi:nucleotide-binding universal stress UspA family protein